MRDQKLNKVSICLDIRGYDKKPQNYEMGSISNRTVSNQVEIDIKDLAQAVTLPNAKAWTPATFKETKHNRTGEFGLWRQNQGWQDQQLFALDIDDKDGKPQIFFQEALERCKRYRILPLFAYNTFRDTGFNANTYHRYRIVFMLPEPVIDVSVRNVVQKSLMRIFPEADNQCQHPCAMFQGGRSIIYEDYDARIDIHDVIHSTGVFFKTKDIKNYAKNHQRYCNDIGLNSIKNTPDIKVEELPYNGSLIELNQNFAPHIEENTISCNKLYMYYRFLHQIVQKYSITLGGEIDKKAPAKRSSKKNSANVESTPERNNLPVIDFDEISSNCKLYREFITGKHWAYHNELMGLATNLIQIRGGENKFFEGLSSRDYGDKTTDFRYYVNFFKQQDYQPERCELYCPYHKKCEHSKNIITTVKTFKNQITQIQDYKPISLQEAEMRLEEVIKKALNSDDRNIHVVKASTGIGKTELFLNIENAIIAVPFHELKEEISDRMSLFTVDLS